MSDASALVLLAGSVAGGAIASVAGFGIGSLLTPLLAAALGVKLAVDAAAIPHAVGTAVRLWLVRAALDRRVLVSFGATSAAGGLAGAVLQNVAGNPVLTIVFAGLGGLTGYSERLRFGRRGAWIGGALSGFLGGLVGNQGGIRSAAMLGFGVPRDAFVATATAIALAVDAARVPVYLVTQGPSLAAHAPLIASAALGVVAGTFLGTWTLRRVPETAFRRVVGAILVLLALYTVGSLRS